MTVMSTTNVSMQTEKLNTQLCNTLVQNASFACENSIKNILWLNLTELSWRETLGNWPYKPGIYSTSTISSLVTMEACGPMEVNFVIGSIYSRTTWERI